MMSNGYYSVVQFCPDFSRMEAANVGVILFCPKKGFLAAKLAPDEARVRRFFGAEGYNATQLAVAKEALENTLETDRRAFETYEDLKRFAEIVANELVVTPPRPISVGDPEADLATLYSELVGEETKAVRPRRAERELAEYLAPLKQSGRVKENFRVTIPVLGRNFRARFAYRNGAINLVKPQPFASDKTHSENTALMLRSEGDLLTHPDAGESYKLIVVPDFPSLEVEQKIGPHVREILGEHARVVERRDLPKFAKEVAAQAHAW